MRQPRAESKTHASALPNLRLAIPTKLYIWMPSLKMASFATS
jgi:hypothetical protein